MGTAGIPSRYQYLSTISLSTSSAFPSIATNSYIHTFSSTSSLGRNSYLTFKRHISDDRLYSDGKPSIFPGVTYLGSASIVAPKTEEEIYKNMEVMNAESKCAITVNLIVPDNSEGFVRLVRVTVYCCDC